MRVSRQLYAWAKISVDVKVCASAAGRKEQWLSVFAALTVGAAFFSLWFWLLPGWLGFRVEAAGTARWRWLAAIPR
jgi:hypothetical protein